MLIGTAQAQALGPPPTPSLWDIFLVDPSFIVMSLVPIAVLIAVALIVRRRYARFFNIQREALDHRKAADAQALARSDNTHQLIEQQYGAVNTHNAQMLARAEEALRISSQTLAKIDMMNQSIARIADRLERLADPAT
jgi:hypothetical protein